MHTYHQYVRSPCIHIIIQYAVPVITKCIQNISTLQNEQTLTVVKVGIIGARVKTNVNLVLKLFIWLEPNIELERVTKRSLPYPQ
jgi:hypothetical protein